MGEYNPNIKRQLESIAKEINQNIRAVNSLIGDLQYHCCHGANQLTADMKAEAVAQQILKDAGTQPREKFMDIDFPKFKICTDLYGIIDVNDFLDLTKYNEEVKKNQPQLTDTAYPEWKETYFSELEATILKNIKPAINKIISIVNNYSGYYYHFKSISQCRIWLDENNNIEAEIIFVIDLK